MKPNLSPLRKAAILISALDDETADALLGQMDPAQADRVRREVFELGAIDPGLEQQVIAEFRRSGLAPRREHDDGIELDSGLAEKIRRSTPAYDTHSYQRGDETPPFRFLHEAEADTLVEFLQNERPQTIALVLSHLPPHQAAEVVERLAGDLQTAVLNRLSDLEEADPEVLREIEAHLQQWVSQQMQSRKRRATGLATVNAILSAAKQSTRGQIVANLARHNSSLAERLGLIQASRRESTPNRPGALQPNQAVVPEPERRRPVHSLRFADLERLNDAALVTLLRAADSQVVVLALAGASAAFVERVIRSLPKDQGRLLRRALKHLGPTRLGDVEDAQQALTDVAAEVAFATAGQRTNR